MQGDQPVIRSSSKGVARSLRAATQPASAGWADRSSSIAPEGDLWGEMLCGTQSLPDQVTMTCNNLHKDTICSLSEVLEKMCSSLRCSKSGVCGTLQCTKNKVGISTLGRVNHSNRNSATWLWSLFSIPSTGGHAGQPQLHLVPS